MASQSSSLAPGRLGDPEMSLVTEPRVHPKLLKALDDNGMSKTEFMGDTKVTLDSPMDEINSTVLQFGDATDQIGNILDFSVPGEPKAPLAKSEELIAGLDGNKIRLLIYRPSEPNGTRLPAICRIHGGGMVMTSTENPMFVTFCEALASAGHVVIAVDFRNGITHAGSNPFPAGLNDCVAAVRWIDAHRQELNISKIVLHGESGGGNLSLATAIKAQREGWIASIDGVAVSVPYISGAYNRSLEWKRRKLPSLVECDGYFLECGANALLVKVYDPSGENEENPLAWPYWASEEDLKGLPPHLIVTNELDPLRDEGNAYFRKLVRAGVRAVGRTNLGVVHGGELLLRNALSDLYLANLWEIKHFVHGL